MILSRCRIWFKRIKTSTKKFAFRKNRVIMAAIRGVAQSGRVLALGARCRRFEPFRPDQFNKKNTTFVAFFYFSSCMNMWKSFNMIYMARSFFIFIVIVVALMDANAASVRGVSTGGRNGVTSVANQMVNPASSYTYNYMYPYMNNSMRTTLKPYDATSQSTSPINTVVRTEQLSAPRRVVPRPTSNTNANTARVATGVTNTVSTNQRRVVARPNSATNQNTNVARSVSRAQEHSFYPTENTTQIVTPARCLADYAECMNRYCERADTAYNRCYCSAKLAQIDAEYQPQIESLVRQIVALKYGASSWNEEEMNEYWSQMIGRYTGDNSWTNIDDALNIDWASMESRVRGQNAFVAGHEYCAQHISGCFYMSSNLRDAYRSTIAKDCAAYEAGLEKLKNAAESVIGAYQE